MTIFPIIQPQTESPKTSLPVYRETAWNYREDRPVWKNGSPVFVERAQAVAVWAWNALWTVRYRHEIYTWDYGNELETLIGQPYSDELKRAEAVRYVRECLMINPYITSVTQISVDFQETVLSIRCKLGTVYGDIELGREMNLV